jgi:hypothetical protein
MLEVQSHALKQCTTKEPGWHLLTMVAGCGVLNAHLHVGTPYADENANEYSELAAEVLQHASCA